MSEEVKIKILNGAEALFLKYGFKSITMDDIARELGISKKTLYQFFEDKISLVDQTVLRHIEHEENACFEMCKNIKNPLEYMLLITDSFSDIKKQINQTILFDLKKYFKETWDKLNQFRIEFIFNQVLDNLKQGKEQGYYHEDLNEVLTARFYIHLVDYMINPDNVSPSEFDFKTIHNEMMRYHLRSICTEKGIKYLHKSTIYQNLK
jgi:TetR/AcrR family transcriptional regulator, cholesterol catabolism regulator